MTGQSSSGGEKTNFGNPWHRFGFDIASAITMLIVPFILIFSEDSDLSRKTYSYLGSFFYTSRSYSIFIGFLQFCPFNGAHKASIKDYHGRTITLAIDV